MPIELNREDLLTLGQARRGCWWYEMEKKSQGYKEGPETLEHARGQWSECIRQTEPTRTGTRGRRGEKRIVDFFKKKISKTLSWSCFVQFIPPVIRAEFRLIWFSQIYFRSLAILFVHEPHFYNMAVQSTSGYPPPWRLNKWRWIVHSGG